MGGIDARNHRAKKNMARLLRLRRAAVVCSESGIVSTIGAKEQIEACERWRWISVGLVMVQVPSLC